MSLDPLRRTVYTGTLIDTPTLGELRVRHHAIVGVDERGCIAFLDEVEDDGEEEEVKRLVRGWGWGSETGTKGEGEVQGGWNWVTGEEGGWWFPGFVGEFISRVCVFLCLGGTEVCFLPRQFCSQRGISRERGEEGEGLGKRI